MRAAYFKEKYKYKFDDIVKQLNRCGADESEEKHTIIEKLILLQIIKKVQKKFIDGDEIIENYEMVLPPENDKQAIYVFNYVGIIKLEGIYVICYPKYFKEVSDCNDVPSSSKLSYVIKSIEKYKKSKSYHQEDFVRDLNSDIEGDFLSIAITLLNDYSENGLYINSKKVIETNGGGDIDWERTIENNMAFLSNGNPYYISCKTSRRKIDQKDFFTELHKRILNDIAIKLTSENDDGSTSVDMSELLGVQIIRFEMDNNIDFNDTEIKEYALNKIDSELKIQFFSRKQELLKIFKQYISGFFGNEYNREFYFGTNSFHVIWEDACKMAFNDCLNEKVGVINKKYKIFKNLPSNQNKKIIDLISKPMWTYSQFESEETLIPDGICLGFKDNKVTFNIIDAKYYCPTLEKNKKPQGVPGIESITKQYLYQMSYKKFLFPKYFKSINNYFLIPYDSEDKEFIIKKGNVELDFMPKELTNIKVRYLKADAILKAYLSERIFAIDLLD